MVAISSALGRNTVAHCKHIHCLLTCGKWFPWANLNKGEICLDFWYKVNSALMQYLFLLGNIAELSITCWCCKLSNTSPALLHTKNNTVIWQTHHRWKWLFTQWSSAKISLILLILVNILYVESFREILLFLFPINFNNMEINLFNC